MRSAPTGRGATMRSLFGLVAGAVAIMSTASGPMRAVAPGQPTTTESATPQRALLDRYCVTCHNQRLRTADLTLDVMDVSDVGAHPEIWEKVVGKMRAGAMPPVSRPRP
ncbi:MAG: hypothetical protein VX975_00475, partial [Acidobacteriota bacterium]|nr:hypothetical protein [Acidobacteriota bacterium]